MVKLHITQIKSGISAKEHQRKTLKALGLRRLNQRVTHSDCNSIRGMIHKVEHLVNVVEVTNETE